MEGELLKLGIEVDHSTISRILQDFRTQGKIRKGITWKKFLSIQIKSIFAMDFFTVDTIFHARFYVFFIIRHATREIIQFAITSHPTIQFVKQQIINFEETIISSLNRAVYMIYDHGSQFIFDLSGFGIKPIQTAIMAPNMNSIAERVVGLIRHSILPASSDILFYPPSTETATFS